jgi:hypothetical protein
MEMIMQFDNRGSQDAARKDSELCAQPKYESPEIRVVGSAVALVQGCGGAAGQDRNYYRIFCQ